MAKFDKELQSYISQVDIAKTDVKTFLKLMGQAQSSFAQTLDCLQATRPFYQDLFKALLKNYHLGWTEFMKAFWNKRLLEFDVNSFDIRVFKYLNFSTSASFKKN